MKTAVSLPDPLFKQAERLAKRLGVSRSELYQEALAVLIGRYNEKAITESYNAVIDRDPEAFTLDPALERMQFARLPEEEW